MLLQSIAAIDLTNIDDSQLSALLTNDWYSQLPPHLQKDRTDLLKLLEPAAQVTPQVQQHA
jgi:hypothetical protein